MCLDRAPTGKGLKGAGGAGNTLLPFALEVCEACGCPRLHGWVTWWHGLVSPQHLGSLPQPAWLLSRCWQLQPSGLHQVTRAPGHPDGSLGDPQGLRAAVRSCQVWPSDLSPHTAAIVCMDLARGGNSRLEFSPRKIRMHHSFFSTPRDEETTTPRLPWPRDLGQHRDPCASSLGDSITWLSVLLMGPWQLQPSGARHWRCLRGSLRAGFCLRLRPPGFRSEVCAPHATPAQLPRLTPSQPQGMDLCPQIILSPSCEHPPVPFLPSPWSRGFCVNSPGPSGTTHTPSSYRAVSVNVASGCSLVCGGQVPHCIALASCPAAPKAFCAWLPLNCFISPICIPVTSVSLGPAWALE